MEDNTDLQEDIIAEEKADKVNEYAETVYNEWVSMNLESLKDDFVEENKDDFVEFCKREWGNSE